MQRNLWLALLCLLMATVPSNAQGEYDGLTFLGKGATLVDRLSDSQMTLLGFQGKYDQKLVGVYLTQHGREIRFYMDPATWDNLKQALIKARDQWETISPTEFAKTGSIKGYRVGNIRSQMRVSIQGETKLDKRRLDFSLTGGGNTPQRTFISIPFEQVDELVDQLHKVDELLRK